MAHRSSQGSHEFSYDIDESRPSSFEHPLEQPPPSITNPTEATSAGSSQTRQPRSEIWQVFEKNLELGKARCRLCGAMYAHKKGDGLGTLKRHIDKKHSGHLENLERQTQIRTTGGVVSGTFRFDPTVSRDAVCQWLIVDDQPFTQSESPHFVEMMQQHQPSFKKIPRTTARTHTLRKFEEMKGTLIAILESTNSIFSLTSDNWKGVNDLYYICVTCHWIDEEWQLNKRIIGFKPFEFPHNARAIARVIKNITREFRIADKILCISFDNASNNTAAIPLLKDALNLHLDGKFFHNRCACHILNLCVQDGYEMMKPTIDAFRHVVLHLRSAPARAQSFRELCRQHGLKAKKLILDMPTRWNSTYEMLRNVLPYKIPIMEFWNMEMSGYELTDEHFRAAEIISQFLSTLKEATELLSGQYYPTTHHVIPTLCSVAYVFKQYREHPIFADVMSVMIDKFRKYYDDMPLLYCIALCLDPRMKVSGCETLIEQFYSFLDLNDLDHLTYETQVRIQQCKEKFSVNLTNIFHFYETEYYAGTSSSTGGREGSSSSSSTPIISSSGFNPYMEVNKRPRRASSSFNELSYYMQGPIVVPETNFDILKWWKENHKLYPVLARMARDFLTPPVSTVSSESAFSLSGRTLDSRRSTMAPEVLEMRMCFRDWINEERRLQQLHQQSAPTDEFSYEWDEEDEEENEE